MVIRTFFLTLLSLLSAARAVTVYGQIPLGQMTTSQAASVTQTASASSPTYSVAAAFDTTTLNAPANPDPPPPTTFTVWVPPTTLPDNAQGLSIPVSGGFYGFSIEMSVATQIIGVNSSFINVPFLNLMSTLVARAGYVHVRVGGNTQDTATLVDSLPDGKALEKQETDKNQPTETPALLFTPELLKLLASVSGLVNVQWYLGVPLNDSANLRLEIVPAAEQLLGDNLVGLQVGNEPDLYARHLHRPSTYQPSDYFNEFGNVADVLGNMSTTYVQDHLLGPSLAIADWTLQQVWDTGFIDAYQNQLSALTVERYPNDNCAAIYASEDQTPKNPQDEFAGYLTHSAGRSLVDPLLNSTLLAQQYNKPFIMFETNTASCGGFLGVSDSFGAGLWALDYGLQMAYGNLSHAMLHVGGRNVYYNPFTPPPTNETAFHQWTIGPIFYSTMIVAEAFGKSNTSRITDLFANGDNVYTPGYAIYENDNLARMVFINFMTDASGAHDYTVTIQVGGGDSGLPNGTPQQIKVKYFLAPSVAEKTNITWAGQTFGGTYASDGIIQGNETIQTINCDQAGNTCQVTVPAPGAVLIFFNDQVLEESTPTTTQTYATTAVTKVANTATVDTSVLATSNGQSGADRLIGGSTSKGSSGASRAAGVVPGVTALLAMAVGAVIAIGTSAH